MRMFFNTAIDFEIGQKKKSWNSIQPQPLLLPVFKYIYGSKKKMIAALEFIQCELYSFILTLFLSPSLVIDHQHKTQNTHI